MAKNNGSTNTPENPSTSILPAPRHAQAGESSRVRAINIASMFQRSEDQIQSGLIRACAQGSIAAWAGQAIFIEGDISHREVNWPIPREVWVSLYDSASSNAHYGDAKPAFSLRDGTLGGKGFSPVVIVVPNARVVDISAIEFQLSRIEFESGDLAYHMRGLEFPNPEQLRCTQKGTLPARATPGDRRNERAAHDAVAFVRSGMNVSAAIREVMSEVDHKNRNPDSVGRAIREAYNLMYDRHGNLHLE